jgi:hypothetical protein
MTVQGVGASSSPAIGGWTSFAAALKPACVAVDRTSQILTEQARAR